MGMAIQVPASVVGTVPDPHGVMAQYQPLWFAAPGKDHLADKQRRQNVNGLPAAAVIGTTLQPAVIVAAGNDVDLALQLEEDLRRDRWTGQGEISQSVYRV